MPIYVKKLCLLIFSFGVLGGMNLNAQIPSIDSTLFKISRDHYPEKAHLHYDKSSYLAGETIWYKIYLMEGFTPAMASKTFYVDWVSDNGEVLDHKASPLIDGISQGQFEIPETYKGQVVHVRAYTKWMLNFDSSVIYKKAIPILPKTNAAARSAQPAIIPTLTLFPEGGDLVAGVANRVAFKATDQWGRPVKIRGVVRETTAVIDSLRTVHDGMGSFSFIPAEGKNYVAKWKDEKGVEYTTPIPSVRSQGVSLYVSENDKKKSIVVHIGTGFKEEQKKINLIGTLMGTVAFKTSGTAAPGTSFRKLIPINELPTGILIITAFDENWNALAERISFINNDDHSFPTTFEVSHWGLNKRARNEVELSIPESLAGANLSISVTDAAIDHDSSSNIISELLLTSELKGQIHNPAYYFKNNPNASAHLDLVMMTNGWRRFKWEDVTKGKLPQTLYPRDTSYLTLSGKLFGVTKGQLSGNESLVLIVKEKDSTSKMLIMPIDRDGVFNDPDIIFFDTLKVYYQVRSKTFGRSGATFMTEKLSVPNYSPELAKFTKKLPFMYDTTNRYHARMSKESADILDAMRGQVMETVTVTARAKPTVEALDEKYASGLFSGGDSYKFDLINDPVAMSSMDVFNYLMGRVPGLQISNSMGGATLSWRGGTPTLFLDQIQTDPDLIKSIPMQDIAYVKVFRPPFIGAMGGGSGGAIALYTRKGNDETSKLRSSGGLSSNLITGYSPIKEFYSPNYNSIDKRHELKDVRPTLYWNPMITANPGKPVKLQFFNNDVTKSFRVIIEGMSKEGILTYYEEVLF
jgi:hypothetical protein